jgi:hypothetical protein
MAYIALALICGPMPLIAYFWSTRRTAIGALIGVAWAVGVALVAGVALTAVRVATAPPPFVPPPFTFEAPVELPGAASATELLTEPLIDTYLPELRAVAERASPLCENHASKPVDGRPSPAKGSALERDPKVLQVEVWCVRGNVKSGFESLKQVPDSRRLGGVWPQRKVSARDPRTPATVTLFVPSSDFDDADQLRYVTDAAVEIDLDLAH